MFLRNLRPAAALLLAAVLLAGCGAKPAAPADAGAPAGQSAAKAPKELRMDYAYYSPLSLVIKNKGWMEAEFKAENIPVKWMLSAGSNKAVEYISTAAADFTSSAGAAALLARANGVPLKSVYIFSKPEWTALVVRKDSPYKSVADLKGKKIAATKGTDPYIFLLRALHTANLTKNDVEIINLQHPDGKTALERKDVEGWAGLDPHMAVTELEQGSQLIYRNPNFNTFGFLNVSEAFAKDYPTFVPRVLKVYEKARQWAIANPDETAKILSDEAKISLDVAKQELKRNDFSKGVPDQEHIDGITAAAGILSEEGLVKAGTDLPAAIKALIDPQYAKGLKS